MFFLIADTILFPWKQNALNKGKDTDETDIRPFGRRGPFHPCLYGEGRGYLSGLLFHPLAGVDEGFYPRRHFVVMQAVGRIVGILPGEDGALQVGHDGQVASVGAGDTCHGV